MSGIVYKTTSIVNLFVALLTLLILLFVINRPTWSQEGAITSENDNLSMSALDAQDENEYSLIIVPLFGKDFPTMNNILAGQLAKKFEEEKIENLKVRRNLGDRVPPKNLVSRVPHYLLTENYDFVIFVHIEFKHATNYHDIVHTFYLQVFTRGVLKPKYILSFDMSVGSNIGNLEAAIAPQVDMLYDDVLNIFRDEVKTPKFTKIYVVLDVESEGQYIFRSNEGLLLQESLGNGEFIAYVDKGRRDVFVDKVQDEEIITIGGFTGIFDKNAYLLEIPLEVEKDIIAQSKNTTPVHKYPFNIDIMGGYFLPFYNTHSTSYIETPTFMLQLLYNLNQISLPLYFGIKIPYSQASRSDNSNIVIGTSGILGLFGYSSVFFTNMEFKIGVASGWTALSHSNVSDKILYNAVYGGAVGVSSLLGYNIPMGKVGYLRIFLDANLLAFLHEDVLFTEKGVQQNTSDLAVSVAFVGALGVGWRF